ncbi:MAG: hypothetical protein ACTS4U_00935 [Candidatus Hodgkinia cicadicola]
MSKDWKIWRKVAKWEVSNVWKSKLMFQEVLKFKTNFVNVGYVA